MKLIEITLFSQYFNKTNRFCFIKYPKSSKLPMVIQRTLLTDNLTAKSKFYSEILTQK